MTAKAVGRDNTPFRMVGKPEVYTLLQANPGSLVNVIELLASNYFYLSSKFYQKCTYSHSRSCVCAIMTTRKNPS